MTRLFVLTGAIALLLGCTPKKLMLGESFVPSYEKTMRESIKTVSSNKETTLNNYYIQVCDVNKGVASNCKTTLVLENVVNYNVRTGWGM